MNIRKIIKEEIKQVLNETTYQFEKSHEDNDAARMMYCLKEIREIADLWSKNKPGFDSEEESNIFNICGEEIISILKKYNEWN